MSINCIAGVGPLLDFDNLTMKYSRPQKPYVSSSHGLEALRIQFPSANEKTSYFPFLPEPLVRYKLSRVTLGARMYAG